MRIFLLILPILLIGCGEGPFGGKRSASIYSTDGENGANGDNGDNGRDGVDGRPGRSGNDGASGFVAETRTQLIFRNEDGGLHPWNKPLNPIITMCHCWRGNMDWEQGPALLMMMKYWGTDWFISVENDCWATFNRGN